MTVIHRPAMALTMVDETADQRTWLGGLLVAHRMTATELARRAGIDPSTLTRFMNGDREGHVLSWRTVQKIKQTLKDSDGGPAGMAEAEAEPFAVEAGAPGMLRHAVNAARAGKNGVDPWIVRGDSLENLRLFDGDIMLIDMNAAAQPGDIVCAQIYDWSGRSARTVFRLYEPPFLLSGSLGASRRPEAIDGRNIIIKGVMTLKLSARDALHLHS